MIVDGKSNKEIAAALDLSANTVAVHRANMMDALGIHKTAELVVYAIRNGLVDFREASVTPAESPVVSLGHGRLGVDSRACDWTPSQLLPRPIPVSGWWM